MLPNLTSLRFFLALFVLLFHLPEFAMNRGFPYYNQLPIFFKGPEAVYVFFTLSGFLIIRNLIKEKQKTGTIHLGRFYKKRALRIFPLYYLVLIFGLIYYNYIVQFFGFEFERNYNLVKGIFQGIFFFPNVLADYKPGGILEVLWSIGIEEQFYIFIAPCFFFIHRKYIIPFLIGFTLLYFLLFQLSILPFIVKFRMYFYFFSMGGLLSYFDLKFQNIYGSKLIELLNYFVFLLIFFTNIFQENFNDFCLHIIYMFNFSITIYYLSQKPIPVLNSKVLEYLGSISYGIYMYHAIVFQIVGFIFLKINIQDNYLQIILFYSTVVITTIGISAMSYKYFESYFLKLK
ncbi:acyltransferase family protein [Faecalibacter rhinopitheci]|uniref:Acyltransferase n=1 Tax=Faecalibacter rhinopitheci TaxID=2779678 RepID=A0A8J7FU26_9FLAO|nr:acyltransferase [Faecalibacter rhinopitheci]MBF0597807.1 acyltransferase [Faecalibacter rhinopitheci]